MVYGFFKEFGLENEFVVNIEINYVILVGYLFYYEVVIVIFLGIFGSVDVN